jgi:tetratricopeptide (TPR) repeat protein
VLFSSWAFRKRLEAPSLAVAVACFGSVIVYIALRRFVLGGWFGPEVLGGENPMFGTTLPDRLLTVFDCAGRYVGLLVWPARLSHDYSRPVLDLVREPTTWALLGLVTTLGLALIAIIFRSRPAGWGAGFALLTFSITSNLPMPIGTIFAERLLYLPSAGFLVVIAAAGTWLAMRGASLRWALRGLLTVALIGGGLRTYDRNRDYDTPETFFEEGVQTQPRSSRLWSNLAMIRSRQGRHEEAARYAATAFQLDSGMRGTREIYASSLEHLGRIEEAVAFLEPIVRFDPGDRKSRRRLIRLLDATGRHAEADSIIEAGIREDPENPAWIMAGARAAQRRGDYRRAIVLWRQVTRTHPTSAQAPISLGFCFLRVSDPGSAREAYAEALRREPGSAAAANGLAWSILELGGPAEEAVRYSRKAVEGDPSAQNYDTLARALLEAGHCEQALDAASKAVELDSTRTSYQDRLRETRERCR